MRTNAFSIFLACTLAATSSISSQTAPLFQTTFYFEDSAGNRDSVVVGYDPNAKPGTIEPQFGEVEVTSPFDSVFEVRALHYDHEWTGNTVKVLIERTENGGLGCVHGLHGIFLVHALHPPVTVSYDSTLFPYDACGNVIFTRDWTVHFVPDWTVMCHHCLTYSSSYLDDFGPAMPPFDGSCDNFQHTEKEVAGQGLKLLPHLLVTTFFGLGTCNDSTFLSSGGLATADMPLPWPNPAVGHISLRSPDGAHLEAEVMDLAGRALPCPRVSHGGELRFDVSGLPRAFTSSLCGAKGGEGWRSAGG